MFTGFFRGRDVAAFVAGCTNVEPNRKPFGGPPTLTQTPDPGPGLHGVAERSHTYTLDLNSFFLTFTMNLGASLVS